MNIRRYDLAYLEEISGGDKDFILDMIQTFVSNAPDELNDLKNIAKNSEWSRLGESAHKFAPGLQFLGLTSLRPVINQIEEFAFEQKKLEFIPELIAKLESQCLQVIDELKKDFNI